MASLPNGTYQPAELSYLDRSREVSKFSCWGAVITAANHDAQATLWADVVTQVQALSEGTLIRKAYESETLYAQVLPGVNSAQREDKLLIRYRNSANGRAYQCTIPCIDYTSLSIIPNTKGYVDLDGITDFVTAFTLFAVDPINSHAIEVMSAQLKTRNV